MCVLKYVCFLFAPQSKFLFASTKNMYVVSMCSALVADKEIGMMSKTVVECDSD